MDFERQLSAFQSEMTKRLDELETKISIITDVSQPPLPIDSSLLATASTSSIQAIEAQPPAPEIDWDSFAKLFETNPEDAVLEVISVIRSSLARKASTRRVIEKANNQYVDQSFQRVSTQMSAIVNQMVLKNHNHLEGEIAEVIQEVDKLKDHMAHEFGEIWALIDDIRRQKAELESESSYPSMFFHGDSQRSRSVTASRRAATLPRSSPRLRGRKKPSSTAKPLAFTLHGTTLCD